MKKALSLIIAVVMVFSMCIPASAAEPAANWIEGAVELKEISFEEAVVRRMQHDGISYEAAKAELLEEENRILSGIQTRSAPRSSIIQYYDYQKNFTYSKNSAFSCALYATIRTFLDDGSTRYIDAVYDESIRRVSGTGKYEWINQSTPWSTIAAGRRSADIGGKGYFQVTVSTSSGVSGSLAGFTVSGTIGSSSIYQSETMSPRATYYVS